MNIINKKNRILFIERQIVYNCEILLNIRDI